MKAPRRIVRFADLGQEAVVTSPRDPGLIIQNDEQAMRSLLNQIEDVRVVLIVEFDLTNPLGRVAPDGFDAFNGKNEKGAERGAEVVVVGCLGSCDGFVDS